MSYRVLAVDDDVFVRSQIKKHLEKEDLTVVEAKNCNEVFDIAWREPFDLIILDVILPDMDGYTICNFLRKHQLTKDVPILFLSSKGTINEKLQGFKAGGDDYLTKPFELAELSARVKTAIEKFHRMKIFEQSVKEADCIREISMLMQVPQEGEQIYTPLLSLLRSFFAVEMAVIYSRGEDPHLPRIEAMDGQVSGYLPRLKKVLTRLQLSQHPLLFPLPAINPHSQPLPDSSGKGSVMVLGSPIIFKKDTLGYILFLTEKLNSISQEHLEQLKHLLPYISVAMYSSKLYDDSKQKISESLLRLNSFYDVTSAMSLSVGMEDVLRMIVRSIKSLLNGDIASIMMLNQSEELEITYAEGLSKDTIENTKIKIGERIAGRVWATKRPALMVDEGGESDIVKSSISIPLVVKDRIKGVLNVSKTARYVFTEEDVECLTHFAILAAQAIEKTELYKDLKGSYEELQNTLFNTILALSRAVEAKDGLTQNHIDRVTKYGLILANLIDPELVHDQNFLYSLMLHDIGKIKMPDNILNKPGPLTPEEFAIIKTHPVEGAKIVEPVLGKSAYSVLYHHERYDGRGYPEGLQGQDIPLSARIIAVADVLDVMTNDRPYKKAQTFSDAVIELKRVSGTQLDPVVVEACLTAIERGIIP